MQKKNKIRENFSGPPFRPQKKKKKNKGPFLAWKLWISPIEKYVNSIFTRKFVVKKKWGPLLPWKLRINPIEKHVN